MTDGTTYFGTDTARYQQDGSYDPGAFEIVNFEDPQRDRKLARNRAQQRPSGVYLWIYPGHDVTADTVHMVDTMRALGADPELGYWADYEDAGVVPGQLGAFFATLDAKAAHGGYYSSPSALDHTPFLARPWWNAAYPTGAVAFPGYGALWASSRPRPMVLWQYTSAGGLDRDVVVDDAWYLAQIHGGAPAPRPAPLHQEDTMIYVGPLFGRIGRVAFLCAGALVLEEWGDDDGGPGFVGPAKMVAWNDQTGRHFDVKFVDAKQMQVLRDHNPAPA